MIVATQPQVPLVYHYEYVAVSRLTRYCSHSIASYLGVPVFGRHSIIWCKFGFEKNAIELR